MAKECPVCGLLSPPEAAHCDCGYDFAHPRPAGARRRVPLTSSATDVLLAIALLATTFVMAGLLMPVLILAAGAAALLASPVTTMICAGLPIEQPVRFC